MTSTTFFTGSAPASNSPAKRSAAAAAPASHAAVAGRAPRAAAVAVAAYPWITAGMLARMSPRARRLIRADY